MKEKIKLTFYILTFSIIFFLKPVTVEAAGQPYNILPEFTGVTNEQFIVQEDCNFETENYCFTFQKGAVIPRDFLNVVFTAEAFAEMKTGMTMDYHQGHYLYANWKEASGFGNVINYPDKERYKFDIIIYNGENLPWGGSTDCATIYYYIRSYESSLSLLSSFYWEFIQALEHNNHPDISLGGTIYCGNKIYVTNEFEKQFNLIDQLSTYMYTNKNSEFDDAFILTAPDAGFRIDLDGQASYYYGVRFMHFLYETYGPDIYNKLYAEAVRRNLNGNFLTINGVNVVEQNNLILKDIIISQTSPIVFEQFRVWYQMGGFEIVKNNLSALVGYSFD